MPRMNPWTPTIMALLFSALAVFESFTEGNKLYFFFFANVPWIFMFVSFSLSQLQKENDELRARLEALEGHEPTADLPENRAVAPG